MRKVVYLVRHGESESNAGPISKGYDAQLTDKGRTQAHTIADRCAKLPIDVLISSPMPRTKDTALAIAATIGKEPEYSDLFVERRRPSQQNGMDKQSAEFKAINDTLFENFRKPGARVSDEEIFEDLHARAIKALAFLEARTDEHILVATHGVFMRILLARAVLGDSLTGESALAFARSFRTKNTGLTILVHGDTSAHAPWEVLTWNDHAHLA